MTLRPIELAEVAGEIAAALDHQPLQKVVQPDGRSLWLGFPRAWLLISLEARAGRLELCDKPAGRGEAAPASCMLLRKELVGARLDGVEVVAGERAAELTFRRGPFPEAPATLRRLRLFFFGAGARALLLDESERVLLAIGSTRGPIALPPPRPLADEISRFVAPFSPAIAAHYASAVAADAVAQARLTAVGAARREVERLARREDALHRDLARADDAADRRRHADLLLAHAAEVPRGAAEVTLPDDFADGAPVRITLDPARSAQDNAARLYREHQRRRRGRVTVETRLAETRAELAAARTRLSRIEAASDDELAGLGRAVTAPAPRPRRAGTPAPRPPYRRYRSATGAEILVGRGAAKNDELTFHVARGDDLWLHTRDFAGAHVVVPTIGKRPVDEATLVDAATLAVHHSPARDEPQADVVYAPRKLVRKPRGAAPGRVSVSGGKTLRLRMEPERLRRLLATLDAP